MKNGKAAGPDEIPAEALKKDLDTVSGMFYELFLKECRTLKIFLQTGKKST